MRRLAALLAAALVAGCGTRDHANPFDPANPATRGLPANFAAFAGRGDVTLEWRAAPAPALQGYELFRSLAPDTGFAPVSNLLPPTTSSFHDVGLLDGTDHYYRLHFVFDAGLSPRYASDVATPGPLRPWVTDYDRITLERITADGRRVVEDIAGAVSIAGGDMDVNRATGAVWTCDPFAGTLTIFDPSSGTLAHAANVLASPVSIAVDAVDGGAWVGDDGRGEALRFHADGSLDSPSVPLTDGPFGIAVDGFDRSVWVCERYGSRVRHAAADGTPLGTGPSFVVAPSRVAVDSATGDAWVSSFTRGTLLRLSSLGGRQDSLSSIASPLNLAMDPRRGRLWVTDPVAGRVVAVRRTGAIEFSVSGLPGAYDVAVDLDTGDAWVTAQDAGLVAHVSASGVILRRLGGFQTPNAIALDPGP